MITTSVIVSMILPSITAAVVAKWRRLVVVPSVVAPKTPTIVVAVTISVVAAIPARLVCILPSVVTHFITQPDCEV